jgi:hypothetical protein
MHVYGNQSGYHLLGGPEALRAGENTIELLHRRIYAEWDDGSQAEWSLAGGFKAWKGDVVFGQGFDRLWPDSWSGQSRLFAFSMDGSARAWRLPDGWADAAAVTLSPLLPTGRGAGVALPVDEGSVILRLGAGTPYQPWTVTVQAVQRHAPRDVSTLRRKYAQAR